MIYLRRLLLGLVLVLVGTNAHAVPCDEALKHWIDFYKSDTWTSSDFTYTSTSMTWARLESEDHTVVLNIRYVLHDENNPIEKYKSVECDPITLQESKFGNSTYDMYWVANLDAETISTHAKFNVWGFFESESKPLAPVAVSIENEEEEIETLEGTIKPNIQHFAWGPDYRLIIDDPHAIHQLKKLAKKMRKLKKATVVLTGNQGPVPNPKNHTPVFIKGSPELWAQDDEDPMPGWQKHGDIMKALANAARDVLISYQIRPEQIEIRPGDLRDDFYTVSYQIKGI